MSSYLGFKIERDELAERLSGSLPKGSLIVVEGPYGAGKSIFTQRVLYGLLENQHSVGVVSTELTTLGFVRQMKSLDYQVDKHLLAQRLLYYPVYPLVGKRHVPHDLLERLRSAAKLYEKDVIIIDTFSKLLADQGRVFDGSAPTDQTMRVRNPAGALAHEVEDTLYHLKRLTAQGKTIILTIESQHIPDALRNLFRDASDIHLSLDFQLIGATASRRIVVNRFSRAKGRFGDVIGYRVEPGIGLVIEIKSVA